MRNTAIGIAVIAVLIGTPALAADMPLKAPPPAPVANSWTGFYIGGNVGWGTGGPNQTITDIATGTLPLFPLAFFPNTTFNDNASSALGGIQLGYNWQFAPTWLAGVEGDISLLHITKSGSVGPPIFSPNLGSVVPLSLSSNTELNALGSVRGRIGYTTPNWLTYFTGGAAWAATKTNGNVSCIGGCFPGNFDAPVSSNATRFGYVLGGGVEYKMDGSPWVFGIEYLHYHFDAINLGTSGYFLISNGLPAGLEGDCAALAQCVAYSAGSFNVDTVRARISYKFGTP